MTPMKVNFFYKVQSQADQMVDLNVHLECHSFLYDTLLHYQLVKHREIVYHHSVYVCFQTPVSALIYLQLHRFQDQYDALLK